MARHTPLPESRGNGRDWFLMAVAAAVVFGALTALNAAAFERNWLIVVSAGGFVLFGMVHIGYFGRLASEAAPAWVRLLYGAGIVMAIIFGLGQLAGDAGSAMRAVSLTGAGASVFVTSLCYMRLTRGAHSPR